MANFDCRETEEYYYRIARKYGVLHVSWGAGHIVTHEDVNNLIYDLKFENSTHETREPFYDLP